jgi:hypothetical protein
VESAGIDPDLVARNYHTVLERMARAARLVGRSPDAVRLVVVTKSHPLAAMQVAAAAGARDIGENYVEEAVEKKLALPDSPGVAWHMIGHVQSRKAQAVCEHFDYLHSLDSSKLANRLDRFAGESGRMLPVLLECNVSGEATKSGFAAWDETHWPELLIELGQIAGLTHIQVRGLMTMAPFLPDPEQARPYVQRLRRLQVFLARHLPRCDWSELSMGMSADYEVAIQEGATWVRIGTAILGPR